MFESMVAVCGVRFVARVCSVHPFPVPRILPSCSFPLSLSFSFHPFLSLASNLLKNPVVAVFAPAGSVWGPPWRFPPVRPTPYTAFSL